MGCHEMRSIKKSFRFEGNKKYLKNIQTEFHKLTILTSYFHACVNISQWAYH